jgi:hypothetical protein
MQRPIYAAQNLTTVVALKKSQLSSNSNGGILPATAGLPRRPQSSFPHSHFPQSLFQTVIKKSRNILTLRLSREEGIRMPTLWSAPSRKRLGPRYLSVYTLSTKPISSYRKAATFQRCGLAERKGFEPSMQFPAYTLSRRAPSTTRTPLFFRVAKITAFTLATEYFLCIGRSNGRHRGHRLPFCFSQLFYDVL